MKIKIILSQVIESLSVFARSVPRGDAWYQKLIIDFMLGLGVAREDLTPVLARDNFLGRYIEFFDQPRSGDALVVLGTRVMAMLRHYNRRLNSAVEEVHRLENPVVVEEKEEEKVEEVKQEEGVRPAIGGTI